MKYEVLPSNVGLQDAALIGAIERYNEMLVERKRRCVGINRE